MIYLDHAATTRLDPEVLAEMMPYLGDYHGNASSVYSLGRESRKAVEAARELTAAFLNARPKEILFTSGGSESDNLALRGVAWGLRHRGNSAGEPPHIITSQVEHHAVLYTCQALEKQGFEVTYLPPDRHGRIGAEQVAEAITERTILISLMHANNEVGTVNPIAEVGALARERGILFHTDAVQSIGQLPTDVKALRADLLSLSAHKFYGPKGVGALYVRSGVRLAPQVTGGDQEFNRRAGTENVPGIVGLGKALELAYRDRETEPARLAALRDRLIAGVLAAVPECELTGHPTERLANHASFIFHGIEGEPLLLNLDIQGIAASSGSACASGSVEPSHVLLAMGFTQAEAHGALRLTLGRENRDADVDAVLAVLPDLVAQLRAMSPAWQQKAALGSRLSALGENDPFPTESRELRAESGSVATS
jgi:cysteine desulfurase